MNILMIGSSYAAAFKQSEHHTPHSVRLAGFSMGLGGFQSLVDFNGGDGLMLDESAPGSQRHLWLISTGGRGPVNFARYDAFLIVGLVPAPNPWEIVNCPQLTDAMPAVVGSRAPISFAAYKRISPYRMCVPEAKRLLGFIRRKDETRPVLFLSMPHVRVDADEYDPQYAAPAHWQALSASEKDLVEHNERCLYARFFKEHGIEALLPPQSLVVDGNRCPAQYSRGALGSANFIVGNEAQWGDTPKQTYHNFVHKNAEYGAVWWESINERLAMETARSDWFSGAKSFFYLSTSLGTYLAYDAVTGSCVAARKEEVLAQSHLSFLLGLVAGEKLKFFCLHDKGIAGISLDSRSRSLIPGQSQVFSVSPVTPGDNESDVNIRLGMHFLCAEPTGGLSLNRVEASNWERFKLMEMVP